MKRKKRKKEGVKEVRFCYFFPVSYVMNKIPYDIALRQTTQLGHGQEAKGRNTTQAGKAKICKQEVRTRHSQAQ